VLAICNYTFDATPPPETPKSLEGSKSVDTEKRPTDPSEHSDSDDDLESVQLLSSSDHTKKEMSSTNGIPAIEKV